MTISRISRTARRRSLRVQERARRARIDALSPEEALAILDGYLAVLARPRTLPRRGSTRPRPQEPRRYRPSTDRPPTLDGRWEDVARMSRSHRSLWLACIRAGWDPDDLSQEVLVRVLARQGMASRYDPARSGLGKYLHVITRSILANLQDRAHGRSVERPAEEAGDVEATAEVSPSGGAPSDGADLAEELHDLVVAGWLPPHAPQVARHLAEGRDARQVAELMGLARSEVREAVEALRLAYS